MIYVDGMKWVGDEKLSYNWIMDDNELKKLILFWGEELYGCWYLRNKRYFFFDVFDIDVIFDSLIFDKWVKKVKISVI